MLEAKENWILTAFFPWQFLMLFDNVLHVYEPTKFKDNETHKVLIMKRWFHLYQVDAEKTTFIYIIIYIYTCLKKTYLLKCGRMFFLKSYVCII